MNEMNRLQELLKKEKVVTTKKLKLIGFNNYSINKLVTERILERVSRGKYVLQDSQESEYFLIQQIIPTGIICLFTAATLYNYTTHIPQEYNLAIKSNYYPTLPKYPPIKLYYWRKTQYELGIKSESFDDSKVNIYDKEKTVCDFLKLRKKMDSNIVNEIVRAYLDDEERNLVKLNIYSKKLKIESVVTKYLDILI